MVVLCFFFFSSRRRHTRSTRDWSSDVCSSDLRRHDEVRRGAHDARAGEDRRPERHHPVGVVDPERRRLRQAAGRSEERRAGKEGRSGGSPEDEKKKEKKTRAAYGKEQRSTCAT